MMSKRMPPALVLSAVLFVTFGFAATKKIQHNDTSGDWNDWSFRAASLVNAGSSVSGGWNTLPSGFENASLLKWGTSVRPPSLSLLRTQTVGLVELATGTITTNGTTACPLTVTKSILKVITEM